MSEIQQRPLAPTELKQHSHTSALITPVSGSVTPPSTAGSLASLSGTAHEADSPLGASPPTGTATQLSTTNGASLAEKSASPRDPTPVSFSNSPPASQAPHEASAAAPGSATQLKQESSEQVLPHIKLEQLPVSSSSSDSSLNAWSSSASAEPKLLTPPPTAVPAATKPSLSENSVNNSVEPSTSVPPQTPASGTIVPNAKSTSQTTNGTTTSKTNISSPVCRNCKTQTTPLWRRDETGQVLCNACGLFLKLHGRPRPISLKTDTIKLRNRIKQTSNPGSKAGTSPNTPELKSRDGKLDSKSGKKSPKPKKKTGELTPLLPAHTARAAPAHTLGVHQTTSAGPTPQFPTPSTYHTHHHHHHLPFATPHMPHLPHHIVQPLHYPLSTPTQFAPSLQRITSPLLLSTTSSVRGNGKSAPVESKPVQPTQAESEAASASAASASAASALETMSSFNADLGPSATFKQRLRDDTSIPGISLMTNTRRSDGTKIEAPPGSIFSTPSSALNAPHPTPPKLPALGSRSSPPNAHLGFAQVPRAHSPETLPPPIHLQHQSQIVQMSSGSYEGNAQPRQGAQDTQNTQKSQIPQESQDNQQADQQNEQNNSQNQQRQNQQLQRNNQNNSGGAGGGAHEVTLLRTRISELELVNDLYRTRIMELEAMEQAARLREGSTRKRLDEVLTHMHESQGQPAQQGPSSSQRMPQTQQVPQNQHIHQQEHQQAGANPTLPHMFNGQLPPPVLHKSGNLLPSLASGGVVLPSLKRDFAGEFHGEGQDEVKKQRI